MRRILASFVCSAWPAFAFAQDGESRNILDGKFLYEEYAGCASCHGLDGKGEVEGVTLDPAPPDLNDCSFSTREPRRDWRAVIAHGGPARGLSMSMPSYAEALSEEQIEAIINHIKTFCPEREEWPQGRVREPRVEHLSGSVCGFHATSPRRSA